MGGRSHSCESRNRRMSPAIQGSARLRCPEDAVKQKKIPGGVPPDEIHLKDENGKVWAKFKIPPGADPRDALNNIVRITNEVLSDSADKNEPLPFPERLFKPKKRSFEIRDTDI